MDYFKKLLDLLKIERNEDREQYKRLTLETIKVREGGLETDIELLASLQKEIT